MTDMPDFLLGLLTIPINGKEDGKEEPDFGNKKATIQTVTMVDIGDDKEEDEEHPSGAISG